MLGTPDYTTERMLAVLRLLRGEYRFGGYIHAKAIPGTSPELLQQLGYLADRLSVNVELPSEREQQFQALWKQFYQTLEIKARHNEKCRMTHCPKRFWADMVEMKDEF